jgi:DNA-binding GntR family transcriptional regulator
MTSTAKTNLRSDVAENVRRRIVEGRLEPGSRINESQLSVELGVSRTPLREALLGLEPEGLIASEASRGFFVAPMSAREVREIYPIGRELDILALGTIRHVPGATLDRLAKINVRFEASRTHAERAKQFDDAFHTTLIGSCPNRRLLEMLAAIQGSMARYERTYMGDAGDVARSARQHRELIDALRADDLPAATAILRDHWDYGAGRLIQMLGEVS